jgi:hypothetical protein
MVDESFRERFFGKGKVPKGPKMNCDENGKPFIWGKIVPASNKGKGTNAKTDNGGWVHLPGTSSANSRYWPDSKEPPPGWIWG